MIFHQRSLMSSFQVVFSNKGSVVKTVSCTKPLVLSSLIDMKH